MAGTIIAYSEITILDLMDTATYIYYADNAEGDNPSANPLGKSYIGIYSGPTLDARPEAPDVNWSNDIWSGWVKYVGDSGKGIKNTTFQYAIGEDSKNPPSVWEDETPDLDGHQGKYLWTKIIFTYDDDTTTESYSANYISKDVNSFYIETNQEEIIRFTVGNNIYQFSPTIFEIKVYDFPIKENAIAKTEFNFDLGVILKEGIYIQTQDVQAVAEKKYYKYEEINGSFSYSEVEYQVGETLSFPLFEFYNKSFYSLKDNAPNYVTKGTVIAGTQQDINLDTIYFNIQSYVNFLTRGDQLKDILTKDNAYLKFSLLDDNGEEIAIKPFSCRNGVSTDLAELNVNAANINAAIQNTKLQFSADGLLIQNGGIKIQNKNGQNVFWADTDGDLTLTGTINADNGYFKGELQGASGSFTGNIKANGGEIGGFEIQENLLRSSAVDDQLEPLIILNGNEGIIGAKNIQIGEGANITNYIKLGDAYLYNPDVNDGKVLESGKIVLTENGQFNLGTIQMYGGGVNAAGIESQAYIQSQNGKWKIWENGQAEFKDIYADNVHLQNTILEIGTVQSVGSLMIFKDAWTVTSISNNIITLDNITNLQPEDWIYSGKEIYKVLEVRENGLQIVLSSNFLGENNSTISKFGKASTEEEQGDFILSALGEDQSILTKRQFEFAQGNSIALSDFYEADYDLIYRKRLVLGQLNGVKDYTDGIGLYCDNVYLEGALVTKIEAGKYAGINTLNNIYSSKFGDMDSSRIVLWAGASNVLDINNAPFQVTESGSVYAKRAKFDDSVFAGGSITGADIYAARIHGWKENNRAALEIYDTDIGISFKSNYGLEEKESFSISKDGLKTSDNYFIKLNNNIPIFYGESFNTFPKESSNFYLSLNVNGLIAIEKTEGEQNSKIYSRISPREGEVVISILENQKAIFQDKKTEIKTEWTQLNQNVQFGTNQYLQYQQTSNGYDLYVLG